MSKSVDRNKAERSLSKKGFKKVTKKDHIYYYHEFEGQETSIKTKVSHSGHYKDIGADNLLNMKEQLRLNTLEETINFLQCPLTEEDYLEILKQHGLLEMPDNPGKN